MEDETPKRSRILEMSGISVRFGNVVALSDVDFHVGRNEVVGLLGDNGAGKSTLVKTLVGLYRPQEGTISFDGRAARFSSPKEARAAGIEIKYQESTLVESMSLARNFFLGRERGPGRFGIDGAAMRATVAGELDKIGIDGDGMVDRPPSVLSGGERQAVLIARAMYFGAKLLILDEPTIALSDEDVGMVLALVRLAKQRGLSVVFITHKANEVFQVADRFVVLRNGRNFANIEKGSLELSQLESLSMYSRLNVMRELSGSMAHQINTPLTVMKVSVEMLRDDFRVEAKEEEYRKITGMLLRKIEAMQYMVRNLLDYVRPLAVLKQTVVVADLVAQAVEELPSGGFPGISIDTSGVDPSIEYSLDATLVKEALSNVLVNALESSAAGAAVEIDARLHEGRLRIEVRDHGPGMDEETRKSVFQFFFTTKESGTGLGLPMVQRIIERHGGTLMIESAPGKGCTLRMDL
jgi:simple sugar transport system ATP-binding protein